MQKVSEGFPLAPLQSHIWTLQKESQNQDVYCVQCVVLLDGQLDPENFQIALQHVVDRNEVLRTVFYHRPGTRKPLQVVLNSSTPILSKLDLSHLNPQEQESKINELASEDRRTRFDFAHGPLLRVQVLALSNKQHSLIITLPSVCMDNWTMRNLVRELALSYAACANGEELSDEPFRYVQFSEWQNQLLEEDDEDSRIGKDHWRKQGQVNAAVLQLPLESNSHSAQGFDPATVLSTPPPEIITRLEKIAHSNETTLQDVLLACWLTLLHKLTGAEEVPVSVQCDGRSFEELSSALGLMARSLPLRAQFSPGSANVSSVLEAVNAGRAQAERWQDYYNYEQTEGGATGLLPLAADAVCPFGFEWQEFPELACEGDMSWTIAQQSVCLEPHKVKLVCVVEGSGKWKLQWQYDQRLLSRLVIERMAEQYKVVLEQVVSRGVDVGITELEVMSDRQRREMVKEYNRRDAEEYEQGACLHELFEAQVTKTPEAVAVVYEQAQLSYEELNRRANQVAHYLRQLGVEAESLVAVMMERSVEMVVGLLGVLKAGGAYVPIDPQYPRERVGYMLQDCGASVLLTQAALVENSESELTGCVVVKLDSEWDRIAAQSEENVQVEVESGNLAYVIYTSGSTGSPKGVSVEHRHIVNYVKAVTDELDLASVKSFAMVSTFSADLGNTVLFPSLATGACLHLVSAERASDPEGLADYFLHHSVECLKIVPSHFAALHGRHPEQMMPRRKLILGGETSRWTWVEVLKRADPDCEIYNHYGPTETTVGVLTYRVPAGETNSNSPTLPLGRPLPNVQVYVLDVRMRLVPMGVIGELYIGGACVTRGYLHRSHLTAERFVPDPFGPNAGARLYRTGDIVRVLSDNNFEYLGRADGQVKVRGYRIELGEIEAVLSQHVSIKEAVVIAREVDNDKRLVAYLVSANAQPLNVSHIRTYLEEHLPQHMVPSWYVVLRNLPLTPNGKVDRQALPEPGMERPELATLFEAPGTAFEKILADIWSEVLGVERVGIRDSFFALGGDSILSVRVVARAKEKGLRFTIQQLFQNQTIKELAGQVKTLDEANFRETEDAQEDNDELARLLEEVDQLTEDQVLLKIEENMQLAEAREL